MTRKETQTWVQSHAKAYLDSTGKMYTTFAEIENHLSQLADDLELGEVDLGVYPPGHIFMA